MCNRITRLNTKLTQPTNVPSNSNMFCDWPLDAKYQKYEKAKYESIKNDFWCAV